MLQQGRLDAASEGFLAVLQANPEHHEALFKMALIRSLQGKLDDASLYYEKVLSLTPHMAEANNNLGAVYYRQGLLDKALARFQHALTQRPRSAEAHNNMANVLKEQGKFEEALACYIRADKLKPGDAGVLNNMGDVLRRLNRFDEAISRLRKAIAIKPALAEAHYNLSLSLFMLGDLAAGLPLYERRLDIESNPQYAASGVGSTLTKLSAVQRWQGEPLHQKSLLIWTEQGIGDSLMMLRYLPLLKGKGVGQVAAYCGPELVSVFEDKVDLVIRNTEPLPAHRFDMHCPVMSLPYVFKTTLASIPNDGPYLTPSPASKKQWATRLRRYPGPKVGLVWAGNRQLKSDHLRSMTLDRYAPLLEVNGVHFFSLQKGDPSKELQSLGWPIQDWMHDCGNILDTAALVANLDLVISVDTAVAHLTGALGKPVWLLNRFESEWRWMMEREDSPWYPSMRIFRQSAVHDWNGVINRVRSELETLARDYRPQPSPPGLAEPRTAPETQSDVADQCNGRGLFAKLFGLRRS
jgi:tetratricopeptide (TPR) repeat protein